MPSRDSWGYEEYDDYMDRYTWNREYEETDYSRTSAEYRNIVSEDGCVSAEYLNRLLGRRLFNLANSHKHKMSCGHETCPNREWPCKEVCLDCFAKSLGPLRKEKGEQKKIHKKRK